VIKKRGIHTPTMLQQNTNCKNDGPATWSANNYVLEILMRSQHEDRLMKLLINFPQIHYSTLPQDHDALIFQKRRIHPN
jgi:hypothetical protein